MLRGSIWVPVVCEELKSINQIFWTISSPIASMVDVNYSYIEYTS